MWEECGLVLEGNECQNQNFLQRGWGKFSATWFEYYQSRFSSTSWPLHKLWMKRRGARYFLFPCEASAALCGRYVSSATFWSHEFPFPKPRGPPGFRKMAPILIGPSRLAGKKCSKTCWNSAILCIFCACVCLMHHVCQLTAHYLCMTSGRLQRSINVPIRQRFVIWAICLFPPFLFVLEQRI